MLYDTPLAAEVEYRHERVKALYGTSSFEQRIRRQERRRHLFARVRRALNRSTHRAPVRAAG